MEKRAALILVLTCILFSVAASAANFEVSSSVLKSRAEPDGEAIVSVTITNYENFEELFRFGFKSVEWTINSEPLSDYFSGVRIGPNETKTSILKLKPSGSLPSGQYRLEIDVRSTTTTDEVPLFFDVYLAPSYVNPQDYIPAVRVTVDAPSEVNPGDTLQIQVGVENLNPLDLNGLSISVKGDLFEKVEETELPGLTKKTLTFSFPVDKFQEPATDKIVVTVTNFNETLKIIENQLRISEYKPSFDQKTETEKTWLKTVNTITFTNNGNVDSAQPVKLATNTFEQFFTSTEPSASVVKEDGRFYSWQISLKPGESSSVQVVNNYRPLAIFIVIIIIAVMLYYSFKSPVLISKQAQVIGVKEGGISKIKVLLNIKNLSKKSIDNLQIFDTIPHIADLEKEVIVGTLEPDKITRTKSGSTKITWSIPSLTGYEERIITYTLKSKLSVLGKFKLPPAKTRFKGPRGNDVWSSSNPVDLQENQ